MGGGLHKEVDFKAEWQCIILDYNIVDDVSGHNIVSVSVIIY